MLHISPDAWAVIIGVVFGVAASIPTSLLIVAATGSRRRRGREAEAAYWQREAMGHPAPPIDAQYRAFNDDEALVEAAREETVSPRLFGPGERGLAVRIIGDIE